MSVKAAMRDGRQIARTLLIDEGVITRPGSGAGTIDPGTGDFTPPASTTIYTGICRVRKPMTGREEQLVFGDVNTTVSRHIVNLPVDTPVVHVGDVFSLTVSDDPQILNVAMRVVVVVSKSVLIYRQLGLELIE